MDARSALDRGDLDVARAAAEQGLALVANQNGAVWLAARLIPLSAGVELLTPGSRN